MKKLIVKTTILALAICIILSVFGMIIDAVLRKSEDNEYSKIFNGNINAELLICGSSRALTHISPMIIDSILNTDSYNNGLDGQPYLMQIAKYNFYREYNKKPKYIIYAVDDMSLHKRKNIDTRLYLPFLNEKTLIFELQNHEGYHFIDYYNPFTKYTFTGKEILREICLFLDIKYVELNHPREKGYSGQSREWDGSFDKFKKQNPNGVIKQSYNKEVFEAFEQFVKTRREEDIKIVFVWTPQYSEYTKMVLNKEEALDFYTNLSAKYNIPFLDYSTDTICDNKSYFYNSQHMNKTGAELFSRKLANDLKEIGFVEE